MSKIPKFTDDREEAAFWDTHDSTDYLDDTQSVEVNFIDTRPPQVRISLRLDADAVRQLKMVARRQGVGYQTLIRMWVMERLQAEIPQPR